MSVLRRIEARGGEPIQDTLQVLWNRQVEFNRKFIDHPAPDEQLRHQKDMVLGMLTEIPELLSSCGGWKNFRFNQPLPSKAGITEECVDIFKFIINVMDTAGVTYDEFVDMFTRKSWVVELRYKWEQELEEWRKDPSTKVVAIDLDGVLVDYPANWINFVNQELGTSYVDTDFNPYIPGGLPVSGPTLSDLKHRFRAEGLEGLSGQLIAGAREFTSHLYENGYKIVILSARPYKEYKRTQMDAIAWMSKYRMYYHAFLWGSDKAAKLHLQVPNVVAMVEDDPVTCNTMASDGIPAYLLDKPWNRWLETKPGVTRISSMYELVSDDRFPRV